MHPDTVIEKQKGIDTNKEEAMHPHPRSFMEHYKAAGKLEGRKAIVTGGDSGIGRATAIGFAKEGADVAIVYLHEDEDAEVTKEYIRREGRSCLVLKGDIGDEAFCKDVVERTHKAFGSIDIVVNNAAEQHIQDTLEKITSEQLERTFRTNIFAQFYLTKAALPFLKSGSSIINTASITAYKGNAELLDYSATKGAIIAFTRSLAQSLATKNIRVNAVAPGPIWTPLITASFDQQHIESFGKNTPLGRRGEPDEVAPCYIFLASEDASYMTGQVLHPNGGTPV